MSGESDPQRNADERRLKYFKNGVDGVGWVRAVCGPLKFIIRRPGTLAGFFMPAASGWRPPGPATRKRLGDSIMVARARSGLLRVAASFLTLKNIITMKFTRNPGCGNLSAAVDVKGEEGEG